MKGHCNLCQVGGSIPIDFSPGATGWMKGSWNSRLLHLPCRGFQIRVGLRSPAGGPSSLHISPICTIGDYRVGPKG